jgi:hypothetical protein
MLNGPFPVYHVTFPDLKTMGLAHFRIQEHYESPRLAGQVFDHEEGILRYMRKGSVFTYAEDWRAFNLPSSAFRAFFDGRFDPLWRLEQVFLGLFRDIEGPFYVISTVEGDDTFLGHELVHALYALCPGYAAEVRTVLRAHHRVLRPFHARLRDTGYAEQVLDDETNAYHVADSTSDNDRARVEPLGCELRALFLHWFGASVRHKADARDFARRVRHVRFPTIPSTKA